MCDITQRSRRIFFVAAESTMIRIYAYLIQKKLFILIVQFACVVNIVIVIRICSLIELKYVFSTPVALRRHRIPRDRATAPSPTYTAALAIPGERTGVAATLGDRRFFKVALPEMANNQYIFCWLNRRGLDSGQAERQLNLHAFSLFFCCYYYCTHMVRSWVAGGRIVLLLSAVLLYGCTHTVGDGSILGGWMVLLLLPHCYNSCCCTLYVGSWDGLGNSDVVVLTRVYVASPRHSRSSACGSFDYSRLPPYGVAPCTLLLLRAASGGPGLLVPPARSKIQATHTNVPIL